MHRPWLSAWRNLCSTKHVLQFKLQSLFQFGIDEVSISSCKSWISRLETHPPILLTLEQVLNDGIVNKFDKNDGTERGAIWRAF